MIGVRGVSWGDTEKSDDVRKGQMEKAGERKWYMENIIPLDVNIVSAVVNKWQKEWGSNRMREEHVHGC